MVSLQAILVLIISLVFSGVSLVLACIVNVLCVEMEGSKIYGNHVKSYFGRHFVTGRVV